MAKPSRSRRIRPRPERRSRDTESSTAEPHVEAEQVVTALRDALERVEREIERLGLPRDRR